MATANILTVNRLKEMLDYDAETGVFAWKLSPTNNVKKGDTAGSKHCKGYTAIALDGSIYLAHRLAWMYVYGKFPDDQIDHINQIKTDNRISNLREATAYDNMKNMPILSTNKTGVTGLSWCKTNNKWRVAIIVDGIYKHIGHFKCKLIASIVAHKAYADNGFHPNHGRRHSEYS